MTARFNKTQPESWPLDAPELAEDNPHALHEHGPRTRAVPGSNPGGPIKLATVTVAKIHFSPITRISKGFKLYIVCRVKWR
jgi:hypothetical protein